ncbi:very short patch repair endonuclease [Leptospira sp. WS58.C1]|uniref:very short patch repair endonuclease n=1 Tax=Leptospira cinconiae TaxID=3235173 RepID=UPI00349E7BB8
MADIFDNETRSRVMSKIRGKGNKTTELGLIVLLKKNRLKGWRRNSKLPGRPDIIFPKQKVAIFADGCFWHGHNCRNVIPKSNIIFWTRKLSQNKARDLRQSRKLRMRGWSVFRIWECKIKKGQLPSKLILKLKILK